MKRAAILFALLLPACDDDGAIKLTVARGPALDDAAAAAIHELRFDFSGPETFQARRPLPSGLGGEERVRYTPQPGVRGMILVSVSGVGDGGAVISSGGTSVDYLGENVSARVELGGPLPDLGEVFDLSTPVDGSAALPDWVPAGIYVRQDLIPDAGGVAAENGVLEIGEKAVLATAWRNATSSTLGPVMGTALSFGGTSASASYQLTGSMASYPATVAGATATPDTGYAVSLGGTRPNGHFDVTLSEQLSTLPAHPWIVHVGGTFADANASTAGYLGIETLAHLGAAPTCTGNQYCPGSKLQTDALATMMARLLLGPTGSVPLDGMIGAFAYSCTAGGASLYSDVPPTDPLCPEVHYVRARGLLISCGASVFCPADAVSRVLLVDSIARAYVPSPPTAYTDPTTGRSYSCDPTAPDVHFTDLGTGNASCAAVHYVWARGDLDGCTPSTFCSASAVSRGDAAEILRRGLRLSLSAP